MPAQQFPPRHRRAIEKWLRRRGYSLRYGRSVRKDEVDFDERCVSIACQTHPTISALHECGHVLISLARKKRPHAKIAGATLAEFNANQGYTNEGRSRLSNFTAGLQVMQEEVVAWERGVRLGKRLRLGIPMPVYQRHATKNAMTYVRWLAYVPVK